MRFVSVRELRRNSAEVWRKLSDERDLIVTSNGKPIAILSDTSEETLEDSLAAIRRARAALALSTIQTQSVLAGTNRMTLDEINAVIAEVRRKRTKRRSSWTRRNQKHR